MLFIDGIFGLGEIARLRDAVATLGTSAPAVERARAHAALGAALRRAGRPLQARDPLRTAVDLAHRGGAAALEEEALAELRATGARPRRRLAHGPGALTRSEHRVAALAATGAMNRAIAEELVVTLATVEYHLRNAYRKLGIASRAELRTALGVPVAPQESGASTAGPKASLPSRWAVISLGGANVESWTRAAWPAQRV
jgi:DNA-binding NarL/FixJ family response regulator